MRPGPLGTAAGKACLEGGRRPGLVLLQPAPVARLLLQPPVQGVDRGEELAQGLLAGQRLLKGAEEGGSLTRRIRRRVLRGRQVSGGGAE